MIKKVLACAAILVLCVIFLNIAYAGLVDYKRRNTGGKAGANRSSATPQAPDNTPFWAKQAPVVEPATKKYDINRDGILQTSEVKIFLRDVIDVAIQKGGYTVDSNIIKAYDKNKDGVINSFELQEIKNQAAR